MNKETIKVNGDSHEVEVKPLTLLFHKGDVNISIPSRVPITPQQTTHTAQTLTEVQYTRFCEAACLREPAEHILGFTLPKYSEFIANEQLCLNHVVGLILLFGLCNGEGKDCFIRFPETYLHPSQQARMADIFVKWSTQEVPVITYTKFDDPQKFINNLEF